MANITTYLQKIMNAIKGEEVRSSIHDAIYEINEEKISAVNEARGYASQASDAAASATSSAQSAANAANNAVESAMDDIEIFVDRAETAANTAENIAATYQMPIVQSTGSSTDSAMSQKATTDALANKADLVNGKVPMSQINIDVMEFKGGWNAETNTPTLTDGIGNKGDMYIVEVGNENHEPVIVPGDQIIYDGSAWIHIPKSGVRSVNGQTGNVQIRIEDLIDTAHQTVSVQEKAAWNSKSYVYTATGTITTGDLSTTILSDYIRPGSLIDVYYADDSYAITPFYTQSTGAFTITLSEVYNEDISFAIKVVN